MNEFSPGRRDERRPDRENDRENAPPAARAPGEDGAFDFDDALRRARREAAERAQAAAERTQAANGRDVIDDERRIGERERLEHLLAALGPILARIPPEADMFDIGVTPGFAKDGGEARPRLFLDMIGYVECAPDGGFRLAQSTRRGRVALGEAKDVAGARRLVADYVARRIVAREEALAGERGLEDAPPPHERREPALPRVANAPPRARPAPWEDEPPPAPRRERAERLRRARYDEEEREPPRPALRRERVEPARRARFGDEDDAPAPLAPARARRTADLREDDADRPTLRERLAPLRARWRRWTEPARARRGGAMERGLVFAVQFLGSAALTLLVAMVAWWAWKAAGFVK